MEVSRESKPPSVLPRSPEAVEWPSVPRHEPEQRAGDITLPDLKTVLSPEFERMSSPQHSVYPQSPQSVRSLPRIDPGYATINGAQRDADVSMTSPVETGSVMSTEDRIVRSTSIVSMEDPDVRIAAEALSGLGNPDFARNARGQNMHMSSHASPNIGSQAEDAREDPEPILELIAQAHPWVGGTIKTSLAAYSTTKYYSPRVVQYSAGLLERNLGGPVVNAVNSVGEMTGIENGVRKYLEARRPGDVEQGSLSRKDEHGEIVGFRPDEQLPPYGASRPPSYREEESPASQHRIPHDMKMAIRPPNSRSWSSQLFVTTSGLSVALSTTSRQSLRFCLKFLQESAVRVGQLSQALALILRDYEAAREQQQRYDSAALEKGIRPATPDQSDEAKQLAESIKKTSDAIWQKLREVVNAVSNYAGGALPDNARDFVRNQLMSLPQRWRVVSTTQQNAVSETSRNGRRMISFAAEGLDMMSQVSGVLQATLNSAEQWLARVGRSDNEDHEMQDDGTPRQLEKS